MNTTNQTSRPFFMLAALIALTSLACSSVFPTRRESLAPTQSVQIVPAQPQQVLPQQVLPTLDANTIIPGDESFVALYAQVNPSVVNISIYADDGQGNILQTSQGSGFVYDDAGRIITNAHVVQGAEQVDVRFSDGIIRRAEILGYDLNSDLAVVQVSDMPDSAHPLPFGTMEELRVGQSVVAIGNPFGLSGSLTRGIISALGRTIPALNVFSIPQSIQTDAAINPGNSGGPLLNLQGEVIGINDQIETADGSRANSGVGFAIPVSIIELVVPSLIAEGSFTWPWIGVRGSELSYELIAGMDLPVEKGAYIWQVVDGGPAAKAGLRGASDTKSVDGRPTDIGGDVVIAINGQLVESFDDMLVYVALKTRPGDTITVTVIRDGAQKDIEIKLEPRPSSN